ncbi:hypothetical protein RRG08_030245 [Elysia crispata]|uniref:Uncharacterized protein n=1 Tax=Elysia crispata TaxID=231223 RepID=A0AAE1AJC6_9GAST|nr:hypothetical protein RRG08_030245 [Elysia crispata]
MGHPIVLTIHQIQRSSLVSSRLFRVKIQAYIVLSRLHYQILPTKDRTGWRSARRSHSWCSLPRQAF